MQWVDVRKNKRVFLRRNQVQELTLNILENTDIEVSLEKNAFLKLHIRQDKNANVNIKFRLEENSRVDYFALTKAKKKGKVLIELNGENASFKGNEVSLSDYDFSHEIIHNKRATFSSLELRGIAKDAKVNSEGKVIIRENASGSEAFLSGKYIALERAEAMFYPNLEIMNKNVKAKHSAAIVKLDEEKMFYLCSKGMSLKKAENMLINSFLNIPEQLK